LSDPVSSKTAPAAPKFVPERLYPALPRPIRPEKKFEWRDVERTIRTVLRDRREARRGIAGRIRSQLDGENIDACQGARIAVYAHYASTGRVSSMVQLQVENYVAEGFEVIFVSMCESIAADDLARLRRTCRSVLMRRSFGRDFGAWRDVLLSDLFKCEQLEELLLVNDSVLGPIRTMAPLFGQMRTAEGVWGLINSDQNGSHLQSFFILARGRRAIDAVFDFFRKLTLSTNKETVINNGELSFSSSLAKKGVPIWSLFSLREVQRAALSDKPSRLETILSMGHLELYKHVNEYVDSTDDEINIHVSHVFIGSPVNPTHQFGEVLVRRFNFPFIKTELVTVNPGDMSVGASWRSLITQESQCSIDMIVEHLCLL
jgi:Rhamnan synthesis protein F